MRVIAGEKKGMLLQGPGKSRKVRPTLDQIKENVFNVFQPIPENCIVLDLFAGTGQMGIEFLSRGAAFAYFCERSRPIARIIEKNIQKTGYENQSQLIYGDFRHALDKIEKKLDAVYLDPPYNKGLVDEALELLITKEILSPSAFVITETESDEIIKDQPAYQIIFDRVYHSQRIRIFQKKEEG